MAEDLFSKISRQWWLGFASLGGAIAVAGVPAHSLGVILIGLGLVIGMLGETVNRQFQQVVTHVNGFGMPAAAISGYPYRPKFPGLALNGVGIGLAIGGLLHLIAWEQF